MDQVHQTDCPVRPLTHGPRCHFFGYYDKPPWSANGRYVLALEADAVERMPEPGEAATVGRVDRQSGQYEALATTTAWNWQQGCMLQWMPDAPSRDVVFNDRRDGQHVAVILDTATGKERLLPRPVYNLSPRGDWAVSVSLARLAHTRLIVGYAGVEDPGRAHPHPADDGLWRMDMRTGDATLLVSFDALANMNPVPSMAEGDHRVEHATVSPDGRRLFFLHRWKRVGKGRPFHDRLYTMNADGSDLHLLCGDDLVSHFCWRDGGHILAWARVGERGNHYYLFRDRSDEATIIGEGVMDRDGHCTYSPNGEWILTDTYPHEWKQRVILYHVATGERFDVAAFHAPRSLYSIAGIRCDLHPRWRQDGLAVCVDTAHDGPRQMVEIDVSQVITQHTNRRASDG